MKKKQVPGNAEHISQAAAILLVTMDKPITAKLTLSSLLENVRNFLGNKRITIKVLKRALTSWLDNGWAQIKGEVLQITRAGRAPISKMADLATSPA